MQTEKHTLQKATATACQLTCTVHLNAFFTHPLKLLKTRILEMQIRATRWKSYLRLLYTVRGDYSEFPKSSEWIRILFFLYLICPIARNQIGDTFQPRFLQNKAVRLFNKVNMQIVEIYWAVSRFWDFFFFFFFTISRQRNPTYLPSSSVCLYQVFLCPTPTYFLIFFQCPTFFF